MSREILFRAKRKDDDEWVEGNLITNERCQYKKYIGYIFDESGRVIEDFHVTEVIPDTVCQYTGLTDRYGKKNWENDIVSIDEDYCFNVHPWLNLAGTKILMCQIYTNVDT